MISLAVFDMAGTTVYDPGYVLQAFRGAIEAAGHKPTDDTINTYMGYPKPYAIREILKADPAWAPKATDAFVTAIHDDFVQRMISFYETDPEVRELPGASDTFRWLRSQGIKVGLDTGFSRPIADAIIQRLGWAELLDVTVTSDEVPNGRPHPDMLLRAMELMGIADPKLVLKAGDTPSDLQEGHAAGAGYNIGVTSGTYSEEALAAYPHTHILPSIAALPALLQPTPSNG